MSIAALSLFEFYEGAAEILGMKKEDRPAMSADFRLAVTQDASAFRKEPVARGANVVDFIANVMNTAVGISLQKFRDR
jgi:hypothetical protein